MQKYEGNSTHKSDMKCII